MVSDVEASQRWFDLSVQFGEGRFYVELGIQSTTETFDSHVFHVYVCFRIHIMSMYVCL